MNRRRKLLTLLVGLPLALLLVAWAWYSSALAPTGGEEKTITIAQGTSTAGIAKQLESEKVVKSAAAFQMHARLNNLPSKFKAGRYALSGRDSTPEVARKLTEPPMDNRLTVKEGSTQREIAEQLDKMGIGITAGDFRELKAGDFDYEWLKSTPKEASLEGFLFPETYDLPISDIDAKKVARVFLDEFAKKLTPEYRKQVFANGHSLFDTVIVASIIEREVRSTEDRQVVAGILWKRLRQDIRLDADATVYYATGKPYTQGLTADDLATDSPYNTRRVKGLPPGPISNPGLSSLQAAANPKDSEYLYYLSAKDGKTIFARTLEEHEANVEKYLR